jgi:hypothetical protein
MIRDFRDVVITGQKAAMGIFITLLEPTKDMIQKQNEQIHMSHLDGIMNILRSKFSLLMTY